MGNEMGNNNTSGLKEEENTSVEAIKKSLIETSHENDIKEENQIVPAAEGKDFHEKVTNLASDDPERIGDPCADSSSRIEQEDTEVHPLAESSKVVLASNEADEGDSKMQPVILSNDSGHEKAIEQKMEENLQGTIKHQLEKQASFKEEVGAISTLHNSEPEESIHIESNQHELDTIHADQSVEEGSGSSQGSEDSQGSSLTSDFEAKGHLLDTEASETIEESADSSTDPVMEKKKDDLLLEQKASQEQLMSIEEKLEEQDGDKVEYGLSNITTISSHGLSGLGNECNDELPTDINLIENDCSQLKPEAIPVTNSPNSHLEVPEPEDKCMILKAEIVLIGKASENGESKHDNNSTQSCGESVVESESDKSSELQFIGSTDSTHEDSEEVSVISPLSDEDYQTEEPKVAKNCHLAIMCVNNQNEASEDHSLDSKWKVEVASELGMVPMELAIPQCNHKEEESTEKKTVQERGDNTEPSYAIEIGGTETAEQCWSLRLPLDQSEALPPQSQYDQQENVFESETVQSISDSIPQLKQERNSEFSAAKASTNNCTNWIAEALVSMNKLEADMPGQQVTQHTGAPQVAAEETKTSANQSSEQCEKFKTSVSVSVSCGSETQETVGRSSTESDSDNSINVQAQIQKSPSFNLDLQNVESDRTPLLCQDKAAIGSSPSQVDNVSLGNLIEHIGYEQDLLQYQAMPVEEKVITLERSESEKPKTPFLGFLKEEEEAHVVDTVQKHDSDSSTENSNKNLSGSHTKEAAPTSSKGKEKRRHRTSLFTNCMCCATVTH